jgi:hypothetical protein
MSDNLKKDGGEKGRGMRLASKESILSEEIRTPSKPLRKITPKLNENLLRRDFFTRKRLRPRPLSISYLRKD